MQIEFTVSGDPEGKLYGYEILETADLVAVLKENRAMMLFDKCLFSEGNLEGWKISRVLNEVTNKIREEEIERENDSGTH
ncbi:hypothetical protein BTH55_02985 [Lactobacillus delbrueckii subsp. bulgaricus]|nr:hypothetical protein [Lactobacillus delbrueckii subsp. bulgaricus]MBT8856864.1 hypothetical protein [Lactobacillus delbrueckii subsp. bulgaricus]MBT8866587.1 hypothetical protein [Lactobacillus delbrueckii subsp. bulgaricus]